MDRKECSTSTINVIKELVEDSKQKYECYKKIYNKCLSNGSDKSDCDQLYKMYSHMEWNFNSWNDYLETRINQCKLIDKYQ